MNWSRVSAIYRKDMRDALRDSRVLTALLMPLAFGLLYSLIFTDVQEIDVGIVSSSRTEIAAAISKQVGSTVRLTFVNVPDTAQLEQRVRNEKLDLGLVVPRGFDAAVRAGAAPVLTLLVPSSPSFDAGYVAAILDRSVQTLAGRSPPAHITQRTLPPASGGSSALDELGTRTSFILFSIVMLLVMIAVYAVPSVLVEEIETRTMEALTLVASPSDVIAAKALFGITLGVASVPLLLVITQGSPHNVAALAAVVVLSAVVLVGVGLLTTRLFKTQQQMNTWSGVVMVLLLAPGFTLGLSASEAVNKILWVLPTGHSFRLIVNAFSGRTFYPDEWVSLGVLALWAVVAYGVLRSQLSHLAD